MASRQTPESSLDRSRLVSWVYCMISWGLGATPAYPANGRWDLGVLRLDWVGCLPTLVVLAGNHQPLQHFLGTRSVGYPFPTLVDMERPGFWHATVLFKKAPA